MGKKQFSRTPVVLPAFRVAALAFLVAAVPIQAQDIYRVTRTENFRLAPDSRAVRLALVDRGTLVRAVGSRGQWLQLDLEGWIWSRSVGRIDSDEHDLSVTARPSENLREEPNGTILARLSTGTLLDEIERDGNWIHVHRVGWMFGESLERTQATEGAVQTTAAPPAEPDSLPAASDVSLAAAVLAPGAVIADTPDGTSRVVTDAESPVRVVGRSGEWVRVQLEGWVRESDLRPADDGVLVGVTGAEVRANPDIYVGQLVQWRLQYVSMQVANELRRDLPEGRPYILARGPVPEVGFVYALVSEEQRTQIEMLPQLSELVVIGRVRRGRSEQLGNPIIELVDFSLREQ